MKEFLINNYSWISTLLFGVVSILIFILKKVKVELKDTPFEKVLSILPSLILTAEKSIKSGIEKKTFVLSSALTLLAELTGSDVADVSKSYSKRISDAIEEILLTPVKKEIKDEVKK